MLGQLWSSPMKMQFSEVSGVTKAVLGGRLDTNSVQDDRQGEAYFFAHIPKEQPAVVDMTDVVAITSLGVRMLINTAKALGRNRLALYGANDNVMDILDNTDLAEIILVVDTEAEAVAAVAQFD